MAIAFKFTPALNETAARWTAVLFVVAIAALAADLTWKLIPGTAETATQVSTTITGLQRNTGPDARQLAEEVAGRHLFGIATAQQATAPVRPVQAPDTRLRLTLRGVVAHDNSQLARAIVAAADGQENAYAIGQEIPGGVTVSEIRADSILLERAGRFEVLRMPKESVGDVVNEAASPAGEAAMLPGSDALGDLRTRPLREIRDALIADPDAVNRLLRVVPIQQGDEFKGFRVMAGSQTHLLERLGFQRGDIVTAVNGVQLDNPIKGLEAMRQITEAQSALEITVMRNGNPQVLNVSLD
ncbi:MAG: type II secretion system protein GspC [Pseudomonadota bacterium]|nr:MAG: type II secretion system protein GspC [Pseudomonadota bacterium]